MSRHLYLSRILILLSGLWLSGNAQVKEEDYIFHRVKEGESISLICIEYYGNYKSTMGEAIKKLNPSIADLNVITVGDKLKLQKPRTALKKKGTSQTIFEKRENIIQGVVTCVEGSVFITKKGLNEKSKLTTNTLVFPGDIIQTGSDGRLEIIINRESVMRMGENTRLTLGKYRNKEKNTGKTTVNLIKGTIWTKVKKFTDRICRFELSLPKVIAGVYGTVYQTSVLDDSTSEVKVFNGEVSVRSNPKKNMPTAGEIGEVPGPTEIPGPHEVTMDEWIRTVRSMQRIKIGKDGTSFEVTSFKKKPSDAWEQWNEERDKRIADIFSEK